MNKKKYITASLVVFVVFFILELINSLILGGSYENYPEFFVAGIGGIGTFYTIIKSLIFGFIFCFIFAKGYEDRGILEGVRYGLWIGLLIFVYIMLSSWSIFAISKAISFLWLILGIIEMVIIGIIAAALYKPAKVEAEAPKQEEPKSE